MSASTSNLEVFEQVVDSIARDARIAPHDPAWVRRSIVTADEKNRILDYILASTEKQPQQLRLLDIGAQIGTLVTCAAQRGIRAAAVDYDFYANRYGKIACDKGVDYRECDVTSQPLPFEENSFDFVTYTDVIEHHAFSPKRVLAEIHRVLSPQGRLILTTSNHASIYNRLFLLFGKSVNDSFEYFFESCADFKVYPGHHREFTLAELCAVLQRTGFRVVEGRVQDEELRSFVRAIKRHPSLGGFSDHRRDLLLRGLGGVWSALHLPFGRFLWVVGEKSHA